MNGIMTDRKKTVIITGIMAAALAAAVFAIAYYSGVLLPKWARWHDVTIEEGGYHEEDEGKERDAPEGPERIVLHKRKVRAYKNGKCIFTSPAFCRVQNMLYADIDRDGEKELILLNFNLKRYGKHRPFWVKHDELKWFQHIYIYDYVAEDEIFRPVWMASDIGMDAADCVMEDGRVLKLTDRDGVESRWMWISFGLRCVDPL